jgi:hypothetical protein
VKITYTKINAEHIALLKQIVSNEYVFTDADNLEKYGQDETEDFSL